MEDHKFKTIRLRVKKSSASVPVQRQSAVSPGEPMMQITSEGNLLEGLLRPRAPVILFYSDLHLVGWGPWHYGEQPVYPQLTDLSVNIIRKCPPSWRIQLTITRSHSDSHPQFPEEGVPRPDPWGCTPVLVNERAMQKRQKCYQRTGALCHLTVLFFSQTWLGLKKSSLLHLLGGVTHFPSSTGSLQTSLLFLTRGMMFSSRCLVIIMAVLQ